MIKVTSWHSYPKIWALGHAGIGELLADPVVIEEKIDGSQFSFGVFGGELKCRSKGQQIIVEAPEKMFTEAVETAKRLSPLLNDGWTYRAEFLAKPKHNTNKYDRVPEQFIILFDVNPSEETYLAYPDKLVEGKRIGLEVVPEYFNGCLASIEQLAKYLDTPSVLGGTIEGVVIKNYSRFGRDKKALMGKFVREDFKEAHKVEWSNSNPGTSDILAMLAQSCRTEARWAKCVQRLRDAGQIEGSPRDIAKLMPSIKADAKEELEAEIKEQLYRWAWPTIERRLVAGMPEWYKATLAATAFDTTTYKI